MGAFVLDLDRGAVDVGCLGHLRMGPRAHVPPVGNDKIVLGWRPAIDGRKAFRPPPRKHFREFRMHGHHARLGVGSARRLEWLIVVLAVHVKRAEGLRGAVVVPPSKPGHLPYPQPSQALNGVKHAAVRRHAWVGHQRPGFITIVERALLLPDPRKLSARDLRAGVAVDQALEDRKRKDARKHALEVVDRLLAELAGGFSRLLIGLVARPANP
ncbi:MAG: hypothetical protein WBM96_21750 [Polyangiales bacterium]